MLPVTHKLNKWNPSIAGAIGECNFGHNRGVSLSQFFFLIAIIKHFNNDTLEICTKCTRKRTKLSRVKNIFKCALPSRVKACTVKVGSAFMDDAILVASFAIQECLNSFK